MTALQVVQLVSDGIGLIACLTLLMFSIVTWQQRSTGRALFAAALTSLLFVVAHTLSRGPSMSPLLPAAELLMLGAWLVLLFRALGLSAANFNAAGMRAVSITALVAAATTVFALIRVWLADNPVYITMVPWFAGSKLVLCIAGLVVIEQLVRNTRADLISRMRYLNIGLGALFAFGFAQSCVVIFFGNSLAVWQAVTPAVVAIPVPFVIVASLRNAENPLRLNLSSQFIFGSGVLVALGIALLLAALLAYYIGLSDQDFGMAALMVLAVSVITAIFLIVGSTRMQAWAQRFIGRHLLADEHDYRTHWNRVTEQLTENDPDFTLEQQSIRALLSLFHSPAGALWRMKEGSFTQTAALHVNWHSSLFPAATEALLARTDGLEEIIDLAEEDESRFQTLDPDARFLVPLVSYGRLFGIVGIATPLTRLALSDEDREIIRLTARQITGFLALREADTALSESRQFEAMHRLTTFLVHDLKTTSAQLSLLLENARQHKTNPAFVEDMLETVGNAAGRLNRLLLEIRGNSRQSEPTAVQLSEILPDLVASFANAQPSPILDHYIPDLTIYVDRDRLFSALQHVVQNAIDATEPDGSVVVKARLCGPWLEFQVEDTGIGMEQSFIDHELFAPFRSTKGVNGMGVGVFQVRETMRAMGGQVHVASTPVSGSTFTLRLPLSETTEAQ